jgi:LysM repeat protein
MDKKQRMTYKCCLLLCSLFISVFTFAQTDDLLIQGATPDLYLLHMVKPKENLYSMGRMYNMAPKEIAAYNKLTIDKPISIGQQIKIPLTLANFSQNNSKGNEEVLVPVYHIVKDKEWMFRISANYNKVPLTYLQQWNNVTNDDLKAGMKLTVGHLKVKQGQSSLAFKGSTNPAPPAPVVVSEPAIPAKKKEEAIPVVGKEEVKPVVNDKPADVAPPPVPQKKEAPVSPEPVKPIENAVNSGVDFKGGYFKSQFNESKKTTNGPAGIFKSVSGWGDGKYYALMNNVPAGTIVKISAYATGKTVYAKVLGALPEMRESIGLTMRVSDAAANELGATHTRFNVEVRY